MDTADYGILDRFFNRLAFYVEKAGYVGRILDDADLSGKHAYNAHDYRAEDLARFFTAVRSREVKLNRLEDILQRALERSGVIVRRGSGFEPGKEGFSRYPGSGGCPAGIPAHA